MHYLLIHISAFAVLAWFILSAVGLACLGPVGRLRWLALTNIGAYFAIWLHVPVSSGYYLGFIGYLGIVGLQYVLTRYCAQRSDYGPVLAAIFPVAALVAMRYGPGRALGVELIGLSYMAFRLSHLVFEVRNGVVPMPSLSSYLSFAFFLPTLVVGPISPYSLFHSSVHAGSVYADGPRFSRGLLVAWTRMVVGATKWLFLSTLLNRLSFDGFINDGHAHGKLDVAIASCAYYAYLYCNFSGFCDIAIGTSALLGIGVEENFDNPLASRNIKEFWNRWHITLSRYLRDMVFAPLSKFLIRWVGTKWSQHAIAASMFVVFVLVGIWHGAGWHYLWFGVAHALAMCINFYYANWLKRRLGRDRFRAYCENPWIRRVCILATNVFVAGTFFCFANDLETMRRMWTQG